MKQLFLHLLQHRLIKTVSEYDESSESNKDAAAQTPSNNASNGNSNNNSGNNSNKTNEPRPAAPKPAESKPAASKPTAPKPEPKPSGTSWSSLKAIAECNFEDTV